MLVALAAISATGVARAAPPLRLEIEPGLVATLDDQQLYLEALPRPRETLNAFSRRLCGSTTPGPQLLQANGGRRQLLAGVRYRVPYAMLTDELKAHVLTTLFPHDERTAEAWRHRVRGAGAGRGEELWHIALWFTGRGELFRSLREVNPQAIEDELPPGSEIAIPAELLLPFLRRTLPPPPVGPAPFTLEYGKDEQGPFAIYRLRPGEALYSAVVVRFTGRLHADDVIDLAREIARRSGIPDVTDIRIGFPVKIPLDLLQPEFLPPTDPRRQEYEADLEASNEFKNEVTATGLEGISVILDAGHGGADVGASVGGVWESLYVYDIMVRVRSLLEARTLARVFTTTRDGAAFSAPGRDVLPFSRGHQVLTTPPYPILDSTVGVHLRWYLANSLFRREVGAQHDPEKVVFVSLHADSLLPTLRGATVYIPGAERTSGSFGKSGEVFASRKEVRERPQVSFSLRERLKSEGLSRQLAEEIVAAFRAARLAVHPYKPVREQILRNRRAWVPAVLRYNAVPAKVLLEVCNLNNGDDRKLLQSVAFRQQVAETLLQGLLRYYDEGQRPKVATRSTR